ncbi:phosphodiester glycosidase family protein [Tsuneonella sp. YG55]|uniref:Phosphodiester glycosidase family protein n=1 Tax=Tsuneonella litorea TaxID=2976475 RepID=A0A9X2W2J0_9SPHN|nr:phosphodiester glycosidase family protein [Tsuneonella litorea]MCT2558686.1 phosphodiester glycosidase family protein [Tsuneonella litorea]
MRGAIGRAALPFLALLGACNEQPAGKAVTRIDLENPDKVATAAPSPAPSPTIASACEATAFEDARLTHCVADPAKHRITTMLGNPPYRGFKAFAETSPDEARRVVFGMNAGMFDGEGKPIGYYVKDGERLKELNRNDGAGNFHMKPNGVFFGGGGKWRVMTSDDFYAQVGDRPEFGTQSGPMLVVDGKLHPEITDDGPSRTIRNGVGVDSAGRAHFVISEGPVSFGKIARYFRDVLKTPNALYLDGGVSSLWDPASGRVDSRTPLGPLLLVEDKSQ